MSDMDENQLYMIARRAQATRNACITCLEQGEVESLLPNVFVRVMVQVSDGRDDYIVTRVSSIGTGEMYGEFSVDPTKKTNMYLKLYLPPALEQLNGAFFQLNSVSNSIMTIEEYRAFQRMNCPGMPSISRQGLMQIAERLHLALRSGGNASCGSGPGGSATSGKGRNPAAPRPMISSGAAGDGAGANGNSQPFCGRSDQLGSLPLDGEGEHRIGTFSGVLGGPGDSKAGAGIGGGVRGSASRSNDGMQGGVAGAGMVTSPPGGAPESSRGRAGGGHVLFAEEANRGSESPRQSAVDDGPVRSLSQTHLRGPLSGGAAHAASAPHLGLDPRGSHGAGTASTAPRGSDSSWAPPSHLDGLVGGTLSEWTGDDHRSGHRHMLAGGDIRRGHPSLSRSSSSSSSSALTTSAEAPQHQQQVRLVGGGSDIFSAPIARHNAPAGGSSGAAEVLPPHRVPHVNGSPVVGHPAARDAALTTSATSLSGGLGGGGSALPSIPASPTAISGCSDVATSREGHPGVSSRAEGRGSKPRRLGRKHDHRHRSGADTEKIGAVDDRNSDEMGPSGHPDEAPVHLHGPSSSPHASTDMLARRPILSADVAADHAGSVNRLSHQGTMSRWGSAPGTKGSASTVHSTPPLTAGTAPGYKRPASSIFNRLETFGELYLPNERQVRQDVMNKLSQESALFPVEVSELKLSQLRLVERDLIEYLEQVREAISGKQLNCVVCLSNAPTVISLPCRHKVLCRLCAPSVKTCPVCRSPLFELFEPEEI